MASRAYFARRVCTPGSACANLQDVAGLLRLNDADACAKTRHLATQKLALIEQKISELATMRAALADLVGRCDRKLKRSARPIIEILQWDSRVDPSANELSRHPNPGRESVFAASPAIAARQRVRMKK